MISEIHPPHVDSGLRDGYRQRVEIAHRLQQLVDGFHLAKMTDGQSPEIDWRAPTRFHCQFDPSVGASEANGEWATSREVI